jgi:hypothetical protein
MGLLDILSQALNAGSANAQSFDQVAQGVSPDILSKGLGAAFQSNETPAIGEMVAQLFGNSNGHQQAGMLNQLLAAVGSGAVPALLSNIVPANGDKITAEQASQLSSQQVQELVDEAHQTNPSIANEIANFYAQHASLINTLGGAALSIAMVKMKDHLEQT